MDTRSGTPIRTALLITSLLLAALPSPSARAESCKKLKDQVDELLCEMAQAKDRATLDQLSQELGKQGESILPKVQKVLQTSKDGKVRSGAVCALATLGTRAGAAIPSLISVLNDPYPPIRLCTLRVLQGIGMGCVRAVPFITPLLKDKDIEVQAQAAQTLGNLWAVAPAAIPELSAVLDSKRDKRVKWEAGRALVRYGALAVLAVPSLRKSMFAPDDTLRLISVRVVGALGPLAFTEIPGLIKSLDDKKSPEVRKAAVNALDRLGHRARAALPALKKALTVEGAPRTEIEAAIKHIEAQKGPAPAAPAKGGEAGAKPAGGEAPGPAGAAEAPKAGTQGPEAKEATPKPAGAKEAAPKPAGAKAPAPGAAPAAAGARAAEGKK